MDVRCDKCATEYELDEAQLKPGGVTVKCTTCGNLFRVRGRADTAVGMGVVNQPTTGETPPVGRSKAASGPFVKAQPGRAMPSMTPAEGAETSSSGGSGKERTWLIRLPTGQVEHCHELATLQQWIISGRVSRNSGISRTGKTWKKLGDIAELASFFRIADEARVARHERSVSMPMPELPAGQPTIQPSGKPTIKPTVKPTGKPSGKSPFRPPRGQAPAQPGARAPTPQLISSTEATEPMPSARAPSASPAPFEHSAPAGEPWTGQPFRASRESGPSGGAVRVAEPGETTTAADVAGPRVAEATHTRSPRESNSWADALKNPDSEIQGPKGGMARGVPTTDVAFAKSRIRPLHEHGREEPDPPDSIGDDFPDKRGSGVGKWIVAASLVIMTGAAIALYVLVFRAPAGTAQAEFTASADAGTTLDAGAIEQLGSNTVAAGKRDGGAAETPPAQAPNTAELLADANKNVLGFDKNALLASEAALAALEGADSEPEILLARARVQTALAQHARDQAQLADQATKAKELARDADQRVLTALPWVKKALEIDRKSAVANALMADIVRLQDKSSRTVDSYLREVRRQDKKSREAELIQALFYIGDKRVRKARPMLEGLEHGAGAMEKSGDIRPTYRLAWLDFVAAQHEDARRRINAILAYAPEHASARALLARIRAATEVDTSDPLPPEDDSGSGGGDSYEALLARADKKAENGDCNAALALYEKAVDIDPLGIAALTGMGYCYIDRGRYASAHDKFNAALVASANYGEALWGIAEAYQQEGKKEQAIKAFQRFLAAHPAGQRADMAKRQIERMGGSVDGGASTDTNTGSSTDTDTGTDTGTEPNTGTGTQDTNGSTGTGSGAGSSSEQPPKSDNAPKPSSEVEPAKLEPAKPEPEPAPTGGDNADDADDAS